MFNLHNISILILSISYNQISSYLSNIFSKKNYIEIVNKLLVFVLIILTTGINIGFLRLFLYLSGYKEELKFEKYIMAFSSVFKNGLVAYISKSLNPKSSDDVYVLVDEGNKKTDDVYLSVEEGKKQTESIAKKQNEDSIKQDEILQLLKQFNETQNENKALKKAVEEKERKIKNLNIYVRNLEKARKKQKEKTSKKSRK
jgi:hypothetical protein